MSDIKKVVKLDFLVMKPYFSKRNFLIYAGLILIYGFFMKYPVIGLILPMVMGVQYISYPFMAGENEGVDKLYFSMGLGDKNVVRGRYLTALLLMVFSMGIGSLCFLLLARFTAPEKEVFSYLLENFIVVFVQFFLLIVQLPILFRFGYKKAGLAYIASLMLAGLVFYLLYYVDTKYFFFTGSDFLIYGVLLGLFIGLGYLSLKYSEKVYQYD